MTDGLTPSKRDLTPIKSRIVGYDTKPADQFNAHPHNWRKHPMRQREAVAASLRELGWIAPVIENQQTGNLIDGHERVWQALQRGEDVPYMVVDLSPEEEVLALATFDAITGMAETDAEALDRLLAEVSTGEAALMELIAETAAEAGLFLDKPDEADAEPQVSRADELQQEWQTATGQLWRLPSRTTGQEHRLICGDARVATSIERLGADLITVLLTDPPYSSGGFQESQRKSGSIGNRQGKQIASDQLSTRGYLSLMSEVLNLVSAEVLYLFTDWRMWCWTYDIAERANYPVRNMLVWDKGRMGMGFPWRSTHELVLFAKRTPSQMMDGKTGNVLHFERASNAEHPTEKPETLIRHILANSPDGDVYDPFSGSGTTLIAAENLGRQCRAVEISPAYVAVALQRYQDAFGITPELVE